MIRIIGNKKVEVTDDEWHLYQEICKSYESPTNPNFKPASLFISCFESNEDGLIQWVCPPRNGKQTSMEIYMFLLALQQQQYLRLFDKRIEQTCADAKQQTVAWLEKAQNKLDDFLTEKK